MFKARKKSIKEQADAFRVYYNKIIFPELVALEKQRKQLIWLFLLAVVFFSIIGYLAAQAHIPALSLFLLIPISLYAAFLGIQIRKFMADFKPRIINLILDFIEQQGSVQDIDEKYNSLGARSFEYDFEEGIPEEIFFESQLFNETAEYYEGEDYIKGRIGNVKFEMSELDVRRLSNVRFGYLQIFRGIFFKANFHTATHGLIVILPRDSRPYMMRTIKGITHNDGYPVDINFPEFEEEFLIYSNNEIRDQDLLSRESYEAILNYHKKTGKHIHVSFVERFVSTETEKNPDSAIIEEEMNKILLPVTNEQRAKESLVQYETDVYIAISEPKDMLEPRLLRSNVNFKLIKEFFDDLSLIISIVEDFDLKH